MKNIGVAELSWVGDFYSSFPDKHPLVYNLSFYNRYWCEYQASKKTDGGLGKQNKTVLPDLVLIARVSGVFSGTIN